VRIDEEQKRLTKVKAIRDTKVRGKGRQAAAASAAAEAAAEAAAAAAPEVAPEPASPAGAESEPVSA
jgi:small subunit ribosomal protein S6